MVAELAEHSELDIGLETREHAACMMVVEKFSAEFEIELVAELSYTLLNMFGLNLEVFVVVESVSHNGLQRYKIFPKIHLKSINIHFLDAAPEYPAFALAKKII